MQEAVQAALLETKQLLANGSSVSSFQKKNDSFQVVTPRVIDNIPRRYFPVPKYLLHFNLFLY
jgi:hypothetical protein